MTDCLVRVFIEIEKDSNKKYELNKSNGLLELDRTLPYPYYYPCAYGFIEKTLAMDNDELDAVIITDKELLKDQWYEAHIIGVLVMSDEKGLDEKVICVLKEDYDLINDISLMPDDILDNIHWFFTNYKNKSPGKWSYVEGFQNKEEAIKIYEKSRLALIT
uniref:inorganic diphosphatase n=1 Tax=viral metagenome TaxID=1070528 RepID=A0A6C0B2F6_9ZZZZ